MAGRGKGSFSGGKVKMGKAKGNMSENQQIQNKQVKDLVKKYNLKRDKQRELHDMISGEGYGYHEIEHIIIELLAK